MSEKKPLITIGMATHQDFDGVYFTIQHLRMCNLDILDQLEFVIIDNSPGTTHSEMIRGLLGAVHAGGSRVKYIEQATPVGTSPARNRIFTEASGDYVLVLDCHVLLYPTALKDLIAYYKANPKSRDILSGPLVYDTLRPDNLATHYGNVWRAEMWGIWESAWIDKLGMIFSVNNPSDGTPCYPISVDMQRTRLEVDDFPLDLGWAGHETVLTNIGFRRIGTKDTDPVIEIPGQGLGLFSCRRDAWLGFHPNADGFGGEELWIHEKFRQTGAKALLLPTLKWVHRFGRANGVSYPLTKGRKLRNYVLEFQQIGLDPTPIHNHFIKELGMNQADWDRLIQDPINWTDEVAPAPGCNTCGSKVTQPSNLKLIDNITKIEEVFEIVSNSPRDLDKHMPKLRELAAQVDHVTEFSNRKESTIAFLAGKPKTFYSFNPEFENLTFTAGYTTRDLVNYHRDTNFDTDQISSIEETDLLFIDSEHTATRLMRELEKFHRSVKRYIVLHDTDVFGSTGQDGKPGLLMVIRNFCRQYPEWSVVYHTKEQYGLTVLSCNPSDKPELPSLLTKAWNYAKALTKHELSGELKVSPELYEARLDTCATCPHRNDGQCSVCGCPLEKKAEWATEDCPLALWPLQNSLTTDITDTPDTESTDSSSQEEKDGENDE